MRDLMLFALCCALAAGYWFSSRQRAEEQAATVQRELYQLGAPQSMEDSPERLLLLGDFAKGLRNDPSPETFERLAPLFLASHELRDRKVLASAHHSELLARVIGRSVELFNPKGEPLTPKLWLIGKKVSVFDKSLFDTAPAPTLVADGPWLHYKDKKRSAVFRIFGDELRGYISTEDISIDEGSLSIAGKTWLWSQGHLEASSDSK